VLVVGELRGSSRWIVQIQSWQGKNRWDGERSTEHSGRAFDGLSPSDLDGHGWAPEG
jgi:hypothetical protein